MNTTKVSHHGTDRKTAAVVGVLFILGTVPALLSLPLMSNTVNAPDHLTAISTNAGQMIVFTAIKFFMGIACAGIGLALYPILKKYNQGLAIGSAGFRLIEGMTSVVGALLYVFLLALSQEFVKAGAPASSYFQTADAVINAGIGWFRDVAMLLTFGIGALMYYVVFYQYRLVPRWLSVWGLVGITLTIISAVLVMFNVIAPFSTIQVIFQLPILPQELVLAVWLIAKGFNPSAGRFSVCENSDERAFERGIDLHYRGEGGLKTLPLPAQHHVYARGMDLKKRTQHITRRKQNVKKRFDRSFNMVRHQLYTRLDHIELCHRSQKRLANFAGGVFFRS